MKKNVTNISGLIKILSLTIMLAFIATLTTNAQGGKANFAGTWTFNAEKSTPAPTGGGGGGGRGFGGGNFVATQDANLLSVSRTRNGQDGTPVTTLSKYTLDGKECVNMMGENESKSTAKWSADGKSLTIVTKTSFNGNDRTSTQVWTLTAPKTLSIVTTGTGRDGAVTTRTQVYEIK
jgi:hypothetical protein